ncbi:MAG TPA: FecR domain-containing protein [Polyangia bacterium]|nr:FecR domain-containing protein [Polyangia bacterium]
MIGGRCRDVEAQLVDAIDGRLDPAASVRLHAHIESCAACRERAALWRGLTPALRALEPAPPQPMSTRRMQIEIERQLAGLTVAPPPRRWRWVWGSTALALAGAAAALVLVLHFQRSSRAPAAGLATVARWSGAVTLGAEALRPAMAVPAGGTLALAGAAEAELAMARGTVVQVTGPARVALGGTAAAVTIRLDDGALVAAVAHRQANETFAVVTPDLRVEVRGTRFSVVKSAAGSRVQVEEGRVLVSFVDGRTQFVSAGESASSFEPAASAAAVTSTQDLPPAAALAVPREVSAARPVWCASVVRSCRDATGSVRASMRGGDPTRALRMLAEHGHAASELEARCGGEELGACQDELRYLHAEALNQAGRLEEAIAAYRAIDRRNAPSAMRQNALYAAAQIERRRGHQSQARADYERALDVAPRGALREEILIGAMETEEVAGAAGRASALARRYLVEFPHGIGAPTARRLVGGGPPP